MYALVILIKIDKKNDFYFVNIIIRYLALFYKTIELKRTQYKLSFAFSWTHSKHTLTDRH